MLIGNHNPPTAIKRSLILAGGGMRVAYQAGVLLALEESAIQFTHVDGTSGGIFNAAMLASGQGAREIAERWRTLKIKQFVSGRKIKEYLNPLFMKGYADADNIRHKVFPHLGIDLSAIRQNGHINATFNVCNFSDKTIEAIGNKAVQEDHLIAGVSLPIFMPALQIGTDWYSDAVWIKDANLMEGVRQQSQELWLVWAIGNSHSYLPGAFNQYVHMIEMSANGALLEEYNQIRMINKQVGKSSEEFTQKTPIRLFVLKSPDPLPLDPDLFFNKINTRELINMGYEHAKSHLNTGIGPMVNMDKNATKNTDPGSVLSFRAVFTGKLIWDSEETKVTYFTYYRFSELGGHQRLSMYSSLLIGGLEQEIPAFDHQVSRIKQKDHTLLEINARLLINGEEHNLKSILKLNTTLETMMGIGYKKISLSIGKASKEHESLLLQGYLYQSISNRLKSCFYTSVKHENGTAGGIGKRYKMLAKLIDGQMPQTETFSQSLEADKEETTDT